jgi:hypothetical protein
VKSLQPQKSNLPGYVVQLPEQALVAARMRHDQLYDQDLQKVYHNAFKAIYLLADSPRLYLLQDEGLNPITLRGEVVRNLNQHTRKPEDNSGRLLESLEATPADKPVQRGKTAFGIYSKQYLRV